MNVFVSTHPFGHDCPQAVSVLKENGLKVKLNPFERKLTHDELAPFLKDVHYLIAGTEGINEAVLSRASHLRFISRVGAGLDKIDFTALKKRGIRLAYTPSGPTRAVAELTLGLLLDCARSFSRADRNLRQGHWHRIVGSSLENKTVGIIGLGRIGKALSKLLQPLGMRILANDIMPDVGFASELGIRFVEKETIYQESDFLSLHVPLTELTQHLIRWEVLKKMKKQAWLINTSRGEVVYEDDLARALKQKVISGAALDVYHKEPYHGDLIKLENVILTCHMGSCTTESRILMEKGASDEVVRFHQGRSLLNEVVL
ncbi:MAG: phosphoglycerate dehydrogenase [Candidatus Aureabacteria bacterium]|nr:phosphoglycerate dehydrogenase [Candidatus Auribacterota bacterium]